MIAECPICGAFEHHQVWTVEKSPLLQLARSREEISSKHFARLEVVRCARCAHLYNRAYDPETWKVTYRADVLSNKPVHITMSAYLESIAEWIGLERIQGKNVIEVGAGSGHLAKLMARHARFVQVFEPSPALTREMLPEGNIELVSEPFSASLVSRKADVIICRQVLEHLADPMGLLLEMRKALSTEGLVYLEVPSAEFIEEHGAFFDLHNAHVQYFYRLGLLDLAAKAGLMPSKERRIKGGHDIGLLLRQVDHASRSQYPIPGESDLERRFLKRLKWIETGLSRMDKQRFIYGATWQAVSFLSVLGSATSFQAALDDNRDYAGHALYSERQWIPVMHPDRINLDIDHLVLVTAYLHKEAITQQLNERGFSGVILSLL